MTGALISCGRWQRTSCGIWVCPRTSPRPWKWPLAGKTRDLDLIWTGKRYYGRRGRSGFDSEVTECANTRIPLLAGAMAYSAGPLSTQLFSFKPKQLKIVHDQGVFEGPVMFAVFGNSKSYGGGMKIAPEAKMDDGLIDVVIVKKIGIIDLLLTMPKVFSGRHLPHHAIMTLRTTRAEITSPDKMDLYGDGGLQNPGPGNPGNKTKSPESGGPVKSRRHRPPQNRPAA